MGKNIVFVEDMLSAAMENAIYFLYTLCPHTQNERVRNKNCNMKWHSKYLA